MTNERISHYELRRPLGAGGMGEVYEAWDTSLERMVALKFLGTATAGDPAALARFEREALEAAKLNHPHIAIVYAFERTGPKPFIAMELLRGRSLRERIAAGPLPIAEALSLARDVAAALAFAHCRGTVHRDIKPENLMFDEHGALKVLDFGLARALEATRLTMTGTSLGTPAYSAPEAVRGETGPPADVFALGLVLYEMLAGRRAFQSEHPMLVVYAIANEEPTPLAEVRPDTPPAVQHLVSKLLLKDPAERPTAADAARELAGLTGVRVSSLELPAEAPSVVSTAAITMGPDTVPTAPQPRRRPWAMFVGLALLLAVGGAAALLLWTGARREQRAEATRLSGLGSAAMSERRIDEARGLFQRALTHDPGNAVALGNLGLIVLDEGNVTSAESLLTQALLHTTNSQARAGVLLNLGEISLQNHAYPAAIERYQEALAADSSYAHYYNNLAWALIQNRQPAEAASVLTRGLSRFPSEPFLLKNAGLAAFQLGDDATARQHLDRAIALDDSLGEAYALRAEVRAHAGDAPGAAADRKRAELLGQGR
jgi:Tfp pilus assembly protein PilF